MTPIDRALLSLEGLALGDAFGQCFFDPAAPTWLEARELPPAPWLWTDDTLMTLSVVEILARHGAIEPDALARSLALHYHFERGYGPAMHRVLARIGAGEAWALVAAQSFEGQGSWGNGAAMRAAPIGAWFADDLDAVTAQAERSARVTHAHPEGVAGAVAVALAAALAWQGRAAALRSEAFLGLIVERLPPSEVRSGLQRAAGLGSPRSLQGVVAQLGNGTALSAPDTVPYALWCCASESDDLPRALWLAVATGGDRDTLAAIVGGVLALRLGMAGLPPPWLARREPLPDWYLR